MSDAANAAVVIPAAGSGERMGGVRKQFMPVGGVPLLARTLDAFLDHPRVGWIVVALPADEAAEPPDWLAHERVIVVAGGASRGESVLRALQRVPEEAELVLVHDAARPIVRRDLIDRTLDAVREGQGAIAALPVSDTIKRVAPDGHVVATPERSELWRAQTPQAFPRKLLLDAYRAAELLGYLSATDDAAVVERFGGRVVVIEGDADNLKITTPSDVVVAEALLAESDWTRQRDA